MYYIVLNNFTTMHQITHMEIIISCMIFLIAIKSFGYYPVDTDRCPWACLHHNDR